MSIFIEFIKELYINTKSKLTLSFVLSIISGISNGIGVVMLIPLLSIAGIIDGISVSNPLYNSVGTYLSLMPRVLSLTIVLVAYILLMIFDALLKRKIAELNSAITEDFSCSLRVQLFEKAAHAEWFCLREKRRSDLVNAVTMDTSRIGAGAIYFLNIVSQVIVSVIHISIALYMSVPVTLSILICGVLFFFYMNSSVKESKKLGTVLHDIHRDLFSQITECLNGLKEVKAYGVEEIQIKKFKSINCDLKSFISEYVRLQAKPDFYYKAGASIIISICFFCAIIIFKVDAVSLLIIIYIFARLWPMFSSFQINLQSIFLILTPFKNIKDLIKTFSDSSEKEDISQKQDNIIINNKISLKNITFKYSDGEYILRDISIDIPKNSMTAIIGHSGSGKSTLADILIGLLQPTTGELIVDGETINGLNLHAWRRCIGYVSQDAFILNDTIRENLVRFNHGVTQQDIEQALELAAARDFVEKLPNGIDTMVGDRGVRLSGGERQRIVLARCLLRKPQLLVLDEATSALDNENERKIQQAIDNFKGKLTMVIIAHRLSTIYNSDNIIALNDGEITDSREYLEKQIGRL